MRKVILLLIMVLSSSFALNYSYDGTIYVEPGIQTNFPIYVQSDLNESGTFGIRCISTARVRCPSSFTVQPGKEKNFTVLVTAELGSHKVNIWFGKDLLKFKVIASNQTRVFLDRLNNYDKIFTKLNRLYGNNFMINDALSMVEEGYTFYNEGDFDSVRGVTENLASLLKEYYNTITPEILNQPNKEPVRLNIYIVPLLLLVGLIIVVYGRKNKKPASRTYVEELTTLVRKEEYEVDDR